MVGIKCKCDKNNIGVSGLCGILEIRIEVKLDGCTTEKREIVMNHKQMK